jgi:light-regulated signal transduction histidine kinase (bacteriophytochrome)
MDQGKFGPVDLDRVMADVITNMRIALAETGAEVLGDPLPVVLVDEQQISQVF